MMMMMIKDDDDDKCLGCEDSFSKWTFCYLKIDEQDEYSKIILYRILD